MSLAGPDLAASRVVDHVGLRVPEIVLQGCEMLVVQLRLKPEGAIGHRSRALEYGAAWSRISSEFIADALCVPS